MILQNAVTVSASKVASSAGSFLSAAVVVTQNVNRVADVVSYFMPIAKGFKDICYKVMKGTYDNFRVKKPQKSSEKNEIYKLNSKLSLHYLIKL